MDFYIREVFVRLFLCQQLRIFGGFAKNICVFSEVFTKNNYVFSEVFTKNICVTEDIYIYLQP